MNSILNRFVEGKYEYELGTLDFSSQKIELTITAGEVFKSDFEITTSQGQKVKGYVSSSQLRMTVLNPEFEGNNITIGYEFNSKGMEEGEVFRGEFYIISELGEYYIPYMVTINQIAMQSTLGSIKNLFHFANLAKTNWQEAVRLFYRKEFSNIFSGNDKQYYASYLGLSRFRGNEQNVDEFLVEINKKQPTEYIPMEETIRIDAPDGISQGKVTITRNGWGFTQLFLETDGDFLSVEKRYLTDDDFLGNLCSFSYEIDSNQLHAGNNFGYVRLWNSCFSIKVFFVVVCHKFHSLSLGVEKEVRQLNFKLMEHYSNFRNKKMPAKEWLAESVKIVDRMNTINEKSVSARLYKAQILITQERYNEAKWLLDNIEKDIDAERVPPQIWCYYLYLTSLYHRNELYVNEITAQIEEQYNMDSGNWRIAWLLLYLKEEFSKSPSKKWLFLEQQFIENSKSPIIYMEAVALLNSNPTLLMKLSEFELQILNYGVKKNILQKEVMIQIRYLAGKEKDYSKRLCYILSKCYEQDENEETLYCICNLLMKGNKFGEAYFYFYEQSVLKELRITRLYEFYMMSLPEDFQKPLPKMVLMYFAYHSELEYRKKAKLFINVLKYQDEKSEIARTYESLLEVFLVEQVKKGHINGDLAYLYKHKLTPFILKEEFSQYFIPLLFTNAIKVTQPQMKQVILVYSKVLGEQAYPIVDGVAYLPIYSTEYKILIQDDKENRYTVNVPYHLEKLMIPGKYVKDMTTSVKHHIGLDMYNCETNRNHVAITEFNSAAFRRLWESEIVSLDYKKEIRLKLLKYYYENDQIRELDDYLNLVEPDYMDNKERAEIIQFFVSRGMLDKAFAWICEYGDEQIQPQILVRLCSRMLVRTEFEKDEMLLKLAFRAFKASKYDDNILKYLVTFYEGKTKDMRNIWRGAIDFDVNSHVICEKIIIQMLFCNSYLGDKDEIFEKYVFGGSRMLVEVAYLSHNAYEYFVKDKMMNSSLFQHFTKLFHRGEQFHQVCKAAYLKYYVENKEEITEEITFLIKKFIMEFLGKHIYFPFFQDFHYLVPHLEQLLDKTMIEYRANPKHKVMIHYIIEKDEDENVEYKKEEMINMFEGIFVKAFVLFFGEKLQYYITEESDTNEQLTESGTISKSDITYGTADSKFQCINDCVISKTLQDYDTVDHLIEEYMEKNFMVDKLFTLL